LRHIVISVPPVGGARSQLGVRTASRHRLPLRKTNNECQIKFELLQIINAPSSTKNADKARDPEMHQTKKGNQWYFGMKAHLGVDSRSKLIHASPGHAG